MALGWPTHQFHRPVVDRLEHSPKPRWATCALTQLGFVRLSSNPAIVGIRKTPSEALVLLGEMVRDHPEFASNTLVGSFGAYGSHRR